MWDDLPKKIPASTKTTIIIIVIIVIAALGYIGWTLFTPEKSCCSSSPFPVQSVKTSGSPDNETAGEVSPTPTISPSPSASVNLQIPDGETLTISSSADTNGDRKEENLVITKMANNKFHAYILSTDGQSLFDNKELDRAPVRIETRIYDSNKESYLSWMLIFTEQSGDLAFIHWDGTKYEIPQENSGI